MTKTLYAIKVPFEDGWLYVQDCRKTTNFGDYAKMVFSDKKDAIHAAQAWKKYEVVELVYNTDKEDYEEAI